MIKLVAFDWNGTLLADSRLAAASDNHALKPYIKKTVSLKLMREYFTVPIMDYLASLGMDKNKYSNHHESINRNFNEYYETRVSRCRTRSGVKNVLKFLKSNKITSIIYSNHVKIYITRQLKRLGMEKNFDVVLARAEDDQSHMHSRGKQQKLQNYVKSINLKPHEVISVGDTEEEIEIGKALGYHTVAITGGYNSTARLKKHHPDFLIHNMLELKKITKKLNHPLQYRRG